MTYGELVKKLRYCGNAVSCLHCPYWAGCGGSKEDLMQAADAIEKLNILANNGEATYEIMVRQLSYIEKLNQKIPHWIPVTERLPEPYTSVLLYSGEKFYTGYMHSDKRFTVNASHFPDRPTHWMPLPEPPKEE